MPAKTKPKKSSVTRPLQVATKTSEVVQPATVEPVTVGEASPRKTQHTFALCLLLAAMVFSVYFRAMKNPFVNYDDQGYVVENLHVQQGLNLTTLRWALTSAEADNWHPLTWLSHALDCQLFGLNAAGHHSTSILLHALNAILLFLLLLAATKKTGRSFAVAAIFALHPINVESVAWVAERKNVLSMFFFLLTLGTYGWYARRPGVARYLAVAGLFALGLAAKPMIVTLPFVLLLLDFWPLQRVLPLPASSVFPVSQSSFWHLALEKLPLLALSVASSWITLIVQRGAMASTVNLPFGARLLNSVYAYSAYIVKAFWPVHLASFYPHEGIRLTGWQIQLSIFLLAAISYGIWRGRARLYLPVGWFWFLGTLVPVIGLVQVGDQGMADRYAYLPLIGLFWIAVWGLADFAESRRLDARVCKLAAALVLAVLSFATWRQIGFWRSSYDLWAHALEVTKDNFVAEDYVGTSLLLQTFEATGQRSSPQALVHFQNAERINPLDPISHLNVGANFHEHGQLQEAIREYQAVLGLTRDPHLLSKSLINLGTANQQLGNFAAARQYYAAALKLDPKNLSILMSLGKLRMEERIQALSAAASDHPSPRAYFQLGQIQQAAGHIPEARSSFQTALKLDPKFADAKAALNDLGASGNP
jgi:tetratricopeptide (TPR) repeat protein